MNREGKIRSGNPILIYDGDCGICLAAAEWLRRRAPHLDLIPFQHLDAAAFNRLGLTLAECRQAVQLVTTAGHRLAGHRAINHLLWQIPLFPFGFGCWPGRLLVSILWLFPPLLLLEWLGYRWVAANRHRIPRTITERLGVSACHFHPGQVEARTVEMVRSMRKE